MELWSVGVMGGSQAELGTNVGKSITPEARSQEKERFNREPRKTCERISSKTTGKVENVL
jgi:hypothetical protein